MSLFAISDLHLSFAADKSMEIFRGWENYTYRLEANWKRLVKNEDTVVLAGDISWAMGLENAVADFEFIESLPGKKIVLKGNHDYWWNTMSKMEKFLEEKKFTSISFLHNNCVKAGEYAVCGSRGWLYDGTGEQDQKVIARECGRLEMSISAAEKTGLEPIVFLHYPPAYGEYTCDEIIEVLRRHNITMLYYGHIHGIGRNQAPSSFEEIKMRLISCDCVDFTPIFIG